MPQVTSNLNFCSPINWQWPVNRGLISRWKVASKGGLRWRDLCDRNPGTLTSMNPVTAWAGTSRPGGAGCLDFDGTDDYVSCGTALDLNGEMTVTAWISTRTITVGSREIIANCDGGGSTFDYICELNRTAAKLSFNWGGSTSILTSTTSLAIGPWYHTAFVRSGASGAWTATIYLNGVADGTNTTATNPNAANQLTAIGRLGAAAFFFFSGQIDDVCIWNRALSPQEVKRIFEDTRLGSPSSLIWMKRIASGRRRGGVFPQIISC